MLTVKTQLHLEMSGPTLLDGPGTLASGHRGRLQVTGERSLLRVGGPIHHRL